MTYTMSKNYDALYDLLCAGGEAAKVLATTTIHEVTHAVSVEMDELGSIRTWSRWCIHHLIHKNDRQREAFIAECTRLNLEWLAPVDLAEILEAGDSLYKRLGSNFPFLSVGPAEAIVEREHWTTATAKFRK